MSFKFSFFDDGDDKTGPDKVNVPTEFVTEALHIKECFVSDLQLKKFQNVDASQFTCLIGTPAKLADHTEEDLHLQTDDSEDRVVRYLIDISHDEHVTDASGKLLKVTDSDLIPNVYEGGLKVWECSMDLCEYLADEQICFDGKSVLELGCGCGLPGLFAYVGGAHVTFSDYNAEVLDAVTIPNVVINTNCSDDVTVSGDGGSTVEVSTIADRCKFLAGDWDSLTERLAAEKLKYDVILTSETIYSTANYDKLHRCLEGLLQPNGTIYLAAKSYYFGVGGGTDLFCEFLTKKNVFNTERVKIIDDGLKREIIRINFKDTDS